ncbi:MAG: DUF3945 domain-containing protein [Dysgonamonadaceae bacterium]|nr:DUF3945 domain-containing protein [Dysgonamonadaceae bacterium]
MNENDVLLVREKGGNELKTAGIDKNGKVKQSKKGSENPDLLRIDKNGNMLENFFENFMRQVKNPTRFEFFLVPAEKLKEIVRKLREAFKNTENPENKAFIDLYRVDPENFLKKQAQIQAQTAGKNYAINPGLVDWNKFEKYGITRENLEKTDNLDKLLDYQKTSLMPVAMKFDGETLRSDARFSLKKMEDGSFAPSVHLIRKEPELEHPYFGIKFTEEDKRNLLTTGNLGRVAEAEFKPGEKTPVLLSIDKQTNELVAFRKEWLKIPDTYKGVQLNDEQKRRLENGEKIKVEGMTSLKGKKFDGEVQFNADKRYFELTFNNDKKQSQTDSIRIPKTLLGVTLSEKQQSEMKAGQSVYVSGMKDREGQDFNAYVKIDSETNKLKFYKWNPDKAKQQPTEKQETKEKTKKTKGVKM